MSQPAKRKDINPNSDGRRDKTQRTSLDAAHQTGANGMGDDSDNEFQYDDDLDDYDEEVIVDGEYMGEDEDEEDAEKPQEQPVQRVWRQGIDKLEADEVLDYDPTTYKVYETLQLEWPALSFDVLKDPKYSDNHITYPVSIYAVCGTQTDNTAHNKVNVLLMENICESKTADDDDGAIDLEINGEEEEDDKTLESVITSCSFTHPGVVNRIRAMPQNQQIISTFSDNGSLYLWDISSQISYLAKELLAPPPSDLKEIYSFNHGVEGYGIAWNNYSPKLATGDRNGHVFVHQVSPDGSVRSTSNADTPFSTGVADNWIECIEWSPNEKDTDVFATVDTKGYLSIWSDKTKRRSPQIHLQAHAGVEINTLSWNKLENNLLATGDDAGVIKIWDLRCLHKELRVIYQQQGPKFNGTIQDADVVERCLQASYSWHKAAITSIHWHPHESSSFVAAGEDNAITIWDLALEEDPDEVAREAVGAQIADDGRPPQPPQLLFDHLGQQEVKEVRFHPQFRSLILSTAANGIDIFRPTNIDVVLPNPNEQPSEKIIVD